MSARAVVAFLAAVSVGSMTAGPALADPPNGPLDHSGTFVVGTDLAPGVYTSAGPLPGEVCSWRRIGVGNVTVDNAMSKQPQIVQIDPSDTAFTTRGCQPWQPSAVAVPPNQIPPWQSQIQLRQALDTLNSLAGQSGNGTLPPY